MRADGGGGLVLWNGSSQGFWVTDLVSIRLCHSPAVTNGRRSCPPFPSTVSLPMLLVMSLQLLSRDYISPTASSLDGTDFFSFLSLIFIGA